MTSSCLFKQIGLILNNSRKYVACMQLCLEKDSLVDAEFLSFVWAPRVSGNNNNLPIACKYNTITSLSGWRPYPAFFARTINPPITCIYNTITALGCVHFLYTLPQKNPKVVGVEISDANMILSLPNLTGIPAALLPWCTSKFRTIVKVWTRSSCGFGTHQNVALRHPFT